VEALLDGEAEKLTRKAIDLGLAGDMAALRLCVDRIMPPRKDRHVAFPLPAMTEPVDAVKALASMVAAVASGELTGVHWLRGETQCEIDAQVEGLIASRQAKETDLFVHWQV
jgi:hypothetical protein